MARALGSNSVLILVMILGINLLVLVGWQKGVISIGSTPPVERNSLTVNNMQIWGVEQQKQRNELIRDFFNRMDPVTAAELFHKLATRIDIKCDRLHRFGRPGDGGYEMCASPSYDFKHDECLVYSFGIAKDWSFDDAVYNEKKCEVHSFDPSIHLEDHMHKPKVHFHNMGLSGTDGVSKEGWKMNSLASIRQNLGHQNRTIDALKIDVEGSEWAVLKSIISDGLFNHIKQFAMEAHTPKFRKSNEEMKAADYADAYITMLNLEDYGFKKYLFHHQNGCCGRFSDFTKVGKRVLCCYEFYYINTRFM